MPSADHAALQRGILLYQQDRPAEAEREFRRGLVADVGDANLHAWLAFALLAQDKVADAEAEARLAVAGDPELDHAHAALAAALRDRGKLKDALAAIDRAIEITGGFASHHHGVRANLLMMQSKYRDALVAADAGLEADPENELCLNMRALAQTHLGDKAAAVATIRGALERNPEDAFTHANHGWAMLHQNRPKEALDHFATAMRLDPTNEFARSGLVEALKAKNPIYRAMLAYFLWMGRQSGTTQALVVVATFFGPRAFRAVGREYPDLRPYAIAAAVVLYAFILMTWLAGPIFNSLLRLHPQGRHALSAEERRDSTLFLAVVGVLCSVALVAVVTRDVFWVMLAAAGALILLPLTSIYKSPRGWPRWTMVAIVAGLAGLLATYAAVEVLDLWAEETRTSLVVIYFVAAFLSQFVAVALAKRT